MAKHPLRDRGPWAQRFADGKSRRTEVPRPAQADWIAASSRDPMAIIRRTVESRPPALVVHRNCLMSQSARSYYRGTADVMAVDLATTAVSGIEVQLCGDCHIENFGVFYTPQRNLTFDINDFDETARGPFEWDIKRLAASAFIVARGEGLSATAARAAAESVSSGYRAALESICEGGLIATWALGTNASAGPEDPLGPPKLVVDAIDAVLKCRPRLSNADDRLKDLKALSGKKADVKPLDGPDEADLRDAVDRYAGTLAAERRALLEHYPITQVASRVAGTGSVGLRSYVALCEGDNASDFVILNVKQAMPSVIDVARGTPHRSHHGKRVVHGQRLMQPYSDPLLGWTSIANASFHVRQLRPRKGEVDLRGIAAAALNDYAFYCGALLAHAHARAGDAAELLGYCGAGRKLDRAIARFAESYARQVDRDFEVFKATFHAAL